MKTAVFLEVVLIGFSTLERKQTNSINYVGHSIFAEQKKMKCPRIFGYVNRLPPVSDYSGNASKLSVHQTVGCRLSGNT